MIGDPPLRVHDAGHILTRTFEEFGFDLAIFANSFLEAQFVSAPQDRDDAVDTRIIEVVGHFSTVVHDVTHSPGSSALEA